ncbi:hypothetical protein HHL11_17990 [Ramlibacter sp. G-1-2-2]|uniref:Tetratricopeptide repeat protein n=1 Tax=Ramlibacter agri TaxID=2728837 RepID=A0A848H3U1_9BURK|nr:hypothetical protein [Ramlibacter agri]NML45646.1 hypothetical protein [Ramlibacter agri]
MDRAFLFEEHASVLPHWVGRHVHGATLVCLDAHLDLQFIEPARIAQLRACRDAAAVAALESPHPLSPRRDACYGIEDFLYAAAQLGVVGRLVWVAPPHVLAEMGAALRALRQMEGVTPEDIASFQRMPGGWFEGRLLGVELVVGALEELVALPLPEPVLVDIDTDYFVQVPEDRLWVRPQAVLRQLRNWLGAGRELTIARSVSSGFLPLRHRFVSDLLAALWEGRAEDVAHGQGLLDMELSGLPLPALPGNDDLLRRLGEIRAHGRPVDLASVLALRREVERSEEDGERRATEWILLGQLYAAFGNAAEASECHEQAEIAFGGHPDLALQVGKLELAAGHPQEALPWLHLAAQDDETRVAAWYHLALCAAALNDPAQGWRWAHAAHEAAPAWDGCGQLERVLAGAAAQPGYDHALAARSSVG